MMSKRKVNLQRLLRPRHIAFVGGADADFSARQCAAYFSGPVWGVNPNRETLGGQPCYPSVGHLPEAPDAVFLATPRDSVIDIVDQLNQMGAGGVVCYTAGYGELGAQGAETERALACAAGDLALVGPNCYGVISYANQSVLWPFGAGESTCTQGIALIMQSGMMSANLTMNQRSVPFVYVISAGNQAVLAMEDYIDYLVDDPAVSAMGLYIEGIVSIPSFAKACTRALEAEKPVVVLKAGSSPIGSQLTVSHTGSLSGTDEAYQALFDQVGVIRAHSPAELLETLKFMTVSGVPKGNRLAAFTCSGGDAALVADYSEKNGLRLTQPDAVAADKLASLLPDIATVSNPLDYTTPLWGNREVMPAVFRAAMQSGYDAAILIQDYPPKAIHADNSHYVSDGVSFTSVMNECDIPSAICSELSENIDQEIRESMINRGVTPLQGIDRGLDAIRNACVYGANRRQILADKNRTPFRVIRSLQRSSPTIKTVNEWECKQRISEHGIAIPASTMVRLEERERVGTVAKEIGFPVVIKLISEDLAHKTELGAVHIQLRDEHEVTCAVSEMLDRIYGYKPRINLKGILVEQMVQGSICELLIGIRQDEQFGFVMIIASGGMLVELVSDAQTLILPVSQTRVLIALQNLRCYPLLSGFRGKSGTDIQMVVQMILKLAQYAEDRADRLVEMEFNPIMIGTDFIVVVDALMREKI